tara:strand:- start:10894 stop:11727 length:834 start_codon:yes stop_codon:yes gene_type:complete
VVLITSANVMHSRTNGITTLSIVSASFLDSEDGYPIPTGSVFYPGEKIHLEFKLTGFTTDKKYRMSVNYRIDFLGPSGVRFSLPRAGEINEEIFPQDEDWLPTLRVSPRLPQFAEPGTYEVTLTVMDRLAGNDETSLTVPILVHGDNVETSTTLLIRNLVFSRERGGEALSTPAYSAGETVWARFHITGYSLAEDNSFDVASSLEVTTEREKDNKVLFRFTASGERGRPFYPRRWLPAEFRLDLDKNLSPGVYTVLISVQDRLGGKTFESRQHFRVK